MNTSKIAQNATFITIKVNLGCQFHTKIHFLTDKRNVLDHFCDVRFVTAEGSENGKNKKSAPKALTDKGRLHKGQKEHLKNGQKRYVYH